MPITPLVPDEMASHEAYRTPSLESGLVVFTIVADAFARNMVRSLVGSCIKVGSGRKSLEWFAGKMAEPVREGSRRPIAPQGLTLEHIAYPADESAGRKSRGHSGRTYVVDSMKTTQKAGTQTDSSPFS